MFWAAAAYASGVVLTSWQWRPMAWWLIAAAALIAFAAYLVRTRTRAAAILSLGAFFCLGALHFSLAAATQPVALDITQFTDGNEVVITGHVVRTGLPRRPAGEAQPAERREVIDVETETIDGSWGKRQVALGVRVTVRSKLAAEQEDEAGTTASAPATSFTYGERIRFPAKLREPRNYGNPGAMDYRAYLRGKGVAALASVSVETFEALEGSAGSRWGRWRNEARNRVAQTMLSAARNGEASWLNLSHEDTALLLAMVIGEQSLLERTTRT